MFIDTHAHIYLNQFAEDLDLVVQNAQEKGVDYIYMPNIDRSTIDAMLGVQTQYPEMCRSMMGLHPCSVKSDYLEELSTVESELKTGKYIAVGEIGTDRYWDLTFWKEQVDAFNIQLSYAESFQLPVAIHCRESLDETIELVSDFKGNISGVFHCFTGTVEQYEMISELGFFVGIGGVSTFKNSGMEDLLKLMSLDNVVIETDSPYLAPVPYRGKRNEPSYIVEVASRIAQAKGISLSKVAEVTSNNAKKLFKTN